MNISKDKLSIYDKMVRDEIQIKAELDFAVEQAEAKGKAEGKAEGILSVARAMKDSGMSEQDILKCTGLTKEQICQL